MSLIKRGDYWHYDFTYRGERYRGTTEQTSKWEAKKVEDEQRKLVRERIAEGHTLSDVLRLWLTERERTKNEKQAIKRLLAKYPSRAIRKVDSGIRDAINGIPSTKNRTISIVNASFALARKRGIDCPPNLQKFKEEKTRLRFLTQDEWQRLEAELSGHVKDIVSFALYTGLRASNVFQLRWAQTHLDTKTVWVDAAEAKGRKAISIPLSKEALSILCRIAASESKNETWVFVYKDNPVKSIKTAFNKALVRAGIEGFRFHDLRHTWASWHVQRGTPLMVLKELGGWADVSMVQRYSHLAPEHLRQWVD